MIEADPNKLESSVSIILKIWTLTGPTSNRHWQWHAKIDQYERTCVSGNITASTSNIDGGGDIIMEFPLVVGAPAMMARLAVIDARDSSGPMLSYGKFVFWTPHVYTPSASRASHGH